MNEPIIKVENLSHRYSIQWAIKDIDFELNKNGVYGLLGANGAGKSTIMNVISGVLKQSHGRVLIKGIDLAKNPVEAKKHIGFLPQKAPIQMELTVEEFLTYCGKIRLMNEAEIPNAVEEVMHKCGIIHFRRRLIQNLSGGYQQRVGIAQAIIHNPDFVVFDEPTNGLDPNQILEVRNLIKTIAQERTVVLSTHILQEVQALCDEIWMINEGRIIFSGSMEDFDSYIAPDTISVSLAAMPSAEEIQTVRGVTGVEVLGGTKYKVQYQDAEDTIDQLVNASVEKDWKLLEIRRDKTSLDAIFSELSKSRKY